MSLIPPDQVGSALDGNVGEIVDGNIFPGSDAMQNLLPLIFTMIANLEKKVDSLIEAIGMNHQLKRRGGGCRPDCWSCRVMETMKGVAMAKKLMAER